MSGLIDVATGLRYGTGLSFEQGLGGPGLTNRTDIFDAFFAGTGNLSVATIARLAAQINWTGAGDLSASTAARLVAAATLAGAGGISAVASPTTRQLTSVFAGVGGLSVTALLQVQALVTLAGAGGLSATPSTSEDPATTAWVNAVIANGGTVSAGRRTLINNLIAGLKADGVWTQLDRLWLFAGENAASALTDLVADSLATAVNSPTFAADLGYTGEDNNLPTKYLDSNYNPNTAGGVYVQNSAHISAWSTTNNSGTSNTGCLMGAHGNTTEDTTLFVTFSDGNVYSRVNDDTGSGSLGAPPSRTGHWIANRTGLSASQCYRNGSSFGTPNQTSNAVLNRNFYILCQQGAGGVPNNGAPNQIAMASIGSGLTGTDATNFYNRLRTYMTAVGVP